MQMNATGTGETSSATAEIARVGDHYAVQGHSRSLTGTNRAPDFPLANDTNLGLRPVSHRLRDSAVVIKLSLWTGGAFTPFPGRQHMNYDGCLELRWETVRTVLCVLCTVISTPRCAVLAVLWLGFCLTGHISLCLESFVFMFVFLCYLVILHFAVLF